MESEEIRKNLISKGLKITPQRLMVYEGVLKLHNHPTAEQVAEYVRSEHIEISLGTIYKVLETLVEHKLIVRVKTENDVMRYDGITVHHHHLYCSETNRIEDYFDEELCKLVSDHLQKKKIPDFEIEDIKLQIIGKFQKKAN